MEERLQSVSSFEQFILLAAIELSLAGETPAHSYDVTQTAKAHLDDLGRDPFGGVERQEVITALRALADAELLEKSRSESATGKGRPAYELAVDADAVLDGLADDPDLSPYVETIRSAVTSS